MLLEFIMSFLSDKKENFIEEKIKFYGTKPKNTFELDKYFQKTDRGNAQSNFHNVRNYLLTTFLNSSELEIKNFF